jgi:hypothetical protein
LLLFLPSPLALFWCYHVGCVLPTNLRQLMRMWSWRHWVASILHDSTSDLRWHEESFWPNPPSHLFIFFHGFFKSPWFFVGTPDWICEGWNRQISAQCEA